MLAEIIFLLSMMSHSSHATINAETLRKNPFKEGFSGGVDLGFAQTQGNVESMDLLLGLRVERQALYPLGEPDERPFIQRAQLFVANVKYGERFDKRVSNQSFFHARWTQMLQPRFGVEGFLQAQSNEFQRLKQRGLIGVGIRLELVHRKALLVSYGLAFMQEFNQLSAGSAPTENVEFWETRASSYLVTRWELIEDRLQVQHTIYYQPALKDIRDYRLLSDLELALPVGENFSLGTQYSIYHDSMPPIGVRRQDSRLSQVVKVSF